MTTTDKKIAGAWTPGQCDLQQDKSNAGLVLCPVLIVLADSIPFI